MIKERLVAAVIENRILRSFKNAVMIIKIVVSTDAFQTNKNI